MCTCTLSTTVRRKNNIMKGEACEMKEARSSDGQQWQRQEQDIARASQWKQVLIENYQQPLTGDCETTKPREGDERRKNNWVRRRAGALFVAICPASVATSASLHADHCGGGHYSPRMCTVCALRAMYRSLVKCAINSKYGHLGQQRQIGISSTLARIPPTCPLRHNALIPNTCPQMTAIT